MRIDAGEHARPRRTADRDVAVSLGESNSAASQPSHVGRLRLSMPAKALDVVVQVVADDQDDVW